MAALSSAFATAYVRLRMTVDPTQTKKDVSKAADDTGKHGGRLFGGSFVKASAGPLRAMGGVLSRSIAGVAAGLAAVAGVKVFAGFVQDARDSAKIARLTESTIRATGGAAKITADQVGRLATALSNKTGKDDEAIQSGQNMLLTFKGIRNEVGKGNDIFNQSSAVLLDMVSAMNNGEVTEANMAKGAIGLGKALNDPIKGITALQRVGVTFTDKQKEQIKTLVEHGKTAQAQKIILAELRSEFGGAAASTSDFGTRLKTVVGNLGEQIGGFLLPTLDRVGAFVVDKLVPGFQAMFAAFQEGDVTSDGLVGGFERVGVAARGAFTFVKTEIIPRLTQFAGIVRDEVLPRLRDFGEFLLTRVVPRVVDLGGKLADLLLPILRGAVKLIMQYVVPALQFIAGVIFDYVVPALGTLVGWLTTAVRWLGEHKDVLASLGIALGVIAAVILAALVPSFIAWAASAGAAAVSTILLFAPIVAIIAVIAALAYGIIQLVRHWDEIWGHIWSFMKTIGAWFAGPFVNAFKTAGNAIVNAAQFVWNWLKANWPLILGILTGPFGLAVVLIIRHWDSIKSGLKTGWDWIVKNVFNPIKNFITVTIPNAFRDGVKAVGTWWDGLKEKAAAPIRFVINTVINDGIIGGINWVASKVGAKGIAKLPMPKGLGDGPGLPPAKGTGDGIGDLFSGIGGGLIGNPLHWLTDRLSGPFNSLRKRFGDNPFTGVLVGAGKKAAGFGVSKIKDLLSFLDIGSSGKGLGAAAAKLAGLGDIGGLQPGILGVLMDLVSVFGNVHVNSGYRAGARTLTGNVSYHASGRAMDIDPVLRWAQYLRWAWGPRLRELITPWNDLNILNGRPHRYTGAVWNQHNFPGGNAHIHAALANGGLIHEPVFGVGASGKTYSLGERGPETVVPGDAASELASIRMLLVELLAAVRQVGQDVSDALHGNLRTQRQLARAR